MIILKSMSDAEYETFINWAVADYAREQIKAGAWTEENATALSRQKFDALLPNGTATPNQFLQMITREEDNVSVGQLWWGVQEQGGTRFATLNNIQIFAEHRQKGYGSKALVAMEKMMQQEGLEIVYLHVFGHNTAARAMYQKMGYIERNITMMKPLQA